MTAPSQHAWPPGVAATWRDGKLTVWAADHRIVRDDEVVAAVFGNLDDRQAHAIADDLATDGRPSTEASYLPWAAVAVRRDGGLAVATSSMLPSGMFWAADDEVVIVASDPGSVVRLRPHRTTLDAEALREQLVRRTDPRRTPLSGIRRVPSGITALWDPAGGRQSDLPWLGPAAWSEPDLSGPEAIEAYLTTIDDVIAGVLGLDGPIAIAMSGGLDSTFIAASLAQATTPDRPVHAFMHVPLAEAGLAPRGRWDPDDSAAAEALVRSYPGRITLTRVTNDERVLPLDASADRARHSWWPVANPANAVWIAALHRRAADVGAQRLVIASQGNAAFSYVPAAQPAALTALGDAARRLTRRDRPRTLRGRLRTLSALGLALEPRDTAGPNGTARERYLRWLAHQRGSAPAAGNPAALDPTIDPFAGRPILDLAARLTTETWRWGERPRGLARRLGEGRVPDEVRLRTRRGAQGWDTWHVMRAARDRYLAEAEALEQTPTLSEVVDIRQAQQFIAGLPWRGPEDPQHAVVTTVNDFLSMAGYARLTATVLDKQWASRPLGSSTPPSDRSTG